MNLLLAALLVVAPPDSLRLPDLLAAATTADPRAAQPALYAEQSDLRQANLSTAWRPGVSVRGQASYQSDATAFATPGQPPHGIPLEQFQVTLNVEQRLYDGGLTRRQHALEAAALAANQAGVAVDLYVLRQQIADAYFNALALQTQRALLDVLDRDLRARLDLVSARVRAGAALPGEADALRAERLRVQQQALEVDAARRTALATLAELTGQPIAPDAALAAPPRAFPAATDDRQRPEYALFDAQRDRLDAQADLTHAATRPQVAAFALGGVARPGYDFLDDNVVGIGQVGVRLTWTLTDWRQGAREREALQVQQNLIATQEAAFARSLRLATAAQRETLARLEAQLAVDDDLIALRERVAAEAARQVDGGTLPVASYIDRENDVFEARLNRDLHRLAHARAHLDLRTILGEEW